MDTGTLGQAEKLVAGGVALVVVSLFLPWITADQPILLVDGTPQSEITGLDSTDGFIAAGAAAVAGVLAWARDWDNWNVGAVTISGIVVAGIALWYITDPLAGAEYQPGVEEIIDPGSGLFVALLGGVLLLGGAISGYRNRPDSQPQPSHAPGDQPRQQPPEQQQSQSGPPPAQPSRQQSRSAHQSGQPGQSVGHSRPGEDTSQAEQQPTQSEPQPAQGQPAPGGATQGVRADARPGDQHGGARQQTGAGESSIVSRFEVPMWTQRAMQAIVALTFLSLAFPWVTSIDGSASVNGITFLLDYGFAGFLFLAIMLGLAAVVALAPWDRQGVGGRIALSVLYFLGVLLSIGVIEEDEAGETVQFDGTEVPAAGVEAASTLMILFVLGLALVVVSVYAYYRGRKSS